MKKLILFVLTVVMALAVTADRTGRDGARDIRILVIETTDLHGYIMDASSGKEETFQYRLARIARLINEARTSGTYDDVLLLDGGDLYQGTPVSNMTGGAVIRAAMDLMRYDAVTLGNHEFDWDVTEYAADRDGTIAPYVLGDRVGDAKTPVLAADLYDAADGSRVPFTRDYAILDKAGLRIAVIGYIPDYGSAVITEKISPYSIDPDPRRLNALVRKIDQTEHPDATVILAHTDPAAVAQAMDPGQTDLVAGGHTHKIAAGTAENGIPYIQGYCYGYGFASAVLVFGTDGSVTAEDLRYTDIMSDRKKLYDTRENADLLDQEILGIAHAGWDAVREEMREVLGSTDTPILRSASVGASSAGNWITGLMLRAAQADGAVMAFYNSGGIRADLNIPKGQPTREITVYDVYSVAPFANSLLVYDISGRELAELLERGLKHTVYGDQMTGLTFTYTATGTPDTPREERDFTVLSVTLDDGTQVDIRDDTKTYRVCTSSYNATVPGSIFEGKEPVVPESDAPTDNETFIRLLREEGKTNGGHIAVDTGVRGIDVTDYPDR